MKKVRILSETPETVTMERSQFEALLNELDEADDCLAVLQSIALETKEGWESELLSMDETLRIIDGESPIQIWRKRRDMTVRQLADAMGIDDTVLTAVENGTERPTKGLLNKLSDRLRVPLDELQAPKS